jgi:hypothetical protein
MAYIGLVDYDEGGRIQSLDGFLGAVDYDDGTTRNMLGANLSTVKYDDGGRFRTLVGLGQDPSFDMPPDVQIDLPLTPPSTDIPLMYEPPTPSPVFDTVSAPITGGLVDYTPTAAPPPMSAGTLVSTPAAPAAASVAPSVLTSIFNGVRNIFSSAGSTVTPRVPGTVLPTVPATASWFSQPSALGVPNWGLLAGVGVGGLLLMGAMGGGGGGGGSRRRNPRRRKNPMELILMGANPSKERIALARSLRRQSKGTRRLALRSMQTRTTPRRFSYGMEKMFSKG